MLQRLHRLLEKRTEYRNENLVLTPFFLNDESIKYSFFKKKTKKEIEQCAKSVEFSRNAGEVVAIFDSENTAEKFTEHELRFWVNMFDLFGIVLDEPERKWRFRLLRDAVGETLQRIPKPNKVYENFYVVTFKNPNDKVLFELSKSWNPHWIRVCFYNCLNYSYVAMETTIGRGYLLQYY